MKGDFGKYIMAENGYRRPKMGTQGGRKWVLFVIKPLFYLIEVEFYDVFLKYK